MIRQGKYSLVYNSNKDYAIAGVPCSLDTKTGKLSPVFKKYGSYKDLREYYKSAGYTLDNVFFEVLPAPMSDEEHSHGFIHYLVCQVCKMYIKREIKKSRTRRGGKPTFVCCNVQCRKKRHLS